MPNGSVLAEWIRVGVCGTDAEIVDGSLVGLRRVRIAWCSGTSRSAVCCDLGPTSALAARDLVVGIVRRPDPITFPNCAVGEWT